jgi:ribonuclease P protein component
MKLIRQSFRKDEILKSDKQIKMLFAQGNSFLVHPFKVNWLLSDSKGKFPARVLLSVSKKNFRKAVERNHIKRLCREAYRKNKYILLDYLDERGIRCNFSLVYIGRKQEEYSVVEKKIITSLKRLISEIESQADPNNPTQ